MSDLHLAYAGWVSFTPEAYHVLHHLSCFEPSTRDTSLSLALSLWLNLGRMFFFRFSFLFSFFGRILLEPWRGRGTREVGNGMAEEPKLFPKEMAWKKLHLHFANTREPKQNFTRRRRVKPWTRQLEAESSDPYIAIFSLVRHSSIYKYKVVLEFHIFVS